MLMSKVNADHNLLFGLLALQTGLINQGALFTAFNAWTRDKDRSMAGILVAHGELDASRRTLLERLVSEHVKMHDDDPEKSLAAIETGRSTRERLAQINDSELANSLALIGSTRHAVDSPNECARPGAVTPSPERPWSLRHEQLLAEQRAGWERGERILVEAYLEREPDLSDHRECLLDLIYNEVVLREQVGEVPGPDEYSTRFPELSTAIREQFEIHRVFADQGASWRDRNGDGSTSVSLGASSSSGLRFRVLRPHAQGGLGAVFVALDTELHREVALKQIHDRLADDPASRRRFLIEAEIAGGLEHPSIVPVYGVGSYANGRPFYAMRFVRGESLKEAITAFYANDSLQRDPGRRSLELRTLLRRFGDVCNAIEYAHSRGVLHRDLKPSNVIIGKHGETLVVDWGLAKSVGRADPVAMTGEGTLIPPSASGSSETLPGSALGTPAFMSPEQAHGDLDRLGPRSDVYSLGATLYALLTGRPPFEGSDVNALLDAVWRGDFVRPRKLDPSIDRPLEAICLKAMARSPEDRYVSARSIADDIERWSADEPVTAWRESLVRQARRWGKRRRTAVTAAAVALVVALLGTGAVLAVQTQANTELKLANGLLSALNDRERRNNTELNASNERERARFVLAMEAIKLFHGEVSQDLLLKEKQFEGLRIKLLHGAAGFYGKLEELLKGHADRPSREALGLAYTELADLTAEIGNKPEALAVHRKALATRRESTSGPDANAQSVLDLVQSLLSVGRLLDETGETPAARSAYGEAQTLAADLAPSSTESDKAQAALAACEEGIGNIERKTGDTVHALLSLRRGLAILETVASTGPAATELQRSLARSHSNIASVLSATGDTAGALQSYSRALAIQEKLSVRNLAVTEIQADVAVSHNDIGLIHLAAGDLAGALQAYQRALAIWEKLAEANPAITRFQNGLAASHSNIGFVHGEASDTARALQSYRQALAIRQKLADSNSAVTEFQTNVAVNFVDIGNVLRGIGDMAAALQSYQRAQSIQAKLAEANPTVPIFLRRLAVIHEHIGYVKSLTDHTVAALQSYQQARAIWERLVSLNPAIAGYQNGAARARESHRRRSAGSG